MYKIMTKCFFSAVENCHTEAFRTDLEILDCSSLFFCLNLLIPDKEGNAQKSTVH